MTKRIVSVIVLSTYLFSTGCSSWKPITLTEIEQDPSRVLDERVRLRYADAPADSSTIALEVASVDFPYLSGMSRDEPKLFGRTEESHPVRLNARSASALDVWALSSTRTGIVVLLGATAIVFVTLLVVGLSDTSFY